MESVMNNEYIKAVEKQIGDKKARQLITAELGGHIIDKADYYMELGYDTETAMQMATADMGDPDDASVPLNALHKPFLKADIVTIILAILLVSVTFLIVTLRGRINYGSYDVYLVYHSAGLDFLSLAFITLIVAVLMRSYKSKNKYATIIVIFILIQFVLRGLFNTVTFSGNTSMFYAFQPACYAISTILTEGIGAYVNSMFQYSAISASDFKINLILLFSAFTFAALLLWSVLQFLIIHLNEKMYNVKTLKSVFTVFKKVVCIILAVNIAVFSAGTAIAAFNLDNTYSVAAAERKQLIDYVINTDFYNDYDAVFNNSKEEFRNLQHISEPLYITQFFGSTYISKNSNSSLRLFEGDSGINIEFRIWSSDSSMPLVSRDMEITSKQTNQLKEGMTLEEFLNLGWYDKAFLVKHYIDPESGKSIDLNDTEKWIKRNTVNEHIQFTFFSATSNENFITFDKNENGTFFLQNMVFSGQRNETKYIENGTEPSVQPNVPFQHENIFSNH